MSATDTELEHHASNISFEEFPVPTKEAWRAEAEATLAGAPFEKKLITKTYEGIDIQPIYRREDLENLEHLGSIPGEAPYVRGTRCKNSWEVAQEICRALPADYNEALVHDLERGQTAINLAAEHASRHQGDADSKGVHETGTCGVSIVSSEDFDTILKGIDTTKVPLFLQCGSGSLPYFALLVAHLTHTGKSLALRGAIEHDPLGDLVADGTLPDSLKASFDQMAVVTKWALKKMPEFGTISVRTDVYHDAGANAVQELAYALATGVEYLRQMEERGPTPNEAAPGMHFSFAIGTDFFMAIAKFRAARMLWSRIVSASGGGPEAQKMRIHARTSLWNKSKLDPYVNMLRGTTEAFAAIAGGCESLHVGPFDEVIRPSDEFSRRIARNTQIILRDECRFDHVVDPAGGSYYVETLTSQLAAKAWSLFQEIEKSGGMAKAILAGVPQQQVGVTAAEKAKAIAQRRQSVIGVNAYANALEKPLEENKAEQKPRVVPTGDSRKSESRTSALERLGFLSGTASEEILEASIAAADEGATLGELQHMLRTRDGALPEAPRLNAVRASEPFEKLRAAVEAAGKPKVFLANMGPLRQHKARADFSTGFFQTGGFQVVENRGFQTVSEAVDAALKSEASIFVVCSTDETYPDLVPAFAALVKDTRPKNIVIVAGYPKDHIETFKAAGVDDFIHIRANCYEVLCGLAAKLGIKL